MSFETTIRAALLVVLLAGCGPVAAPEAGSAATPTGDEGKADDGTEADDGPPAADPIVGDADGDLLSTSLEIHLAEERGRATIEVLPSAEGRVALEVAGLEIRGVTRDGEPLEHSVEEGLLEARFAEGGGAVTVHIDYGFTTREELEGAATSGLTMLWPYHCGNLFPCQSDPAEGSLLELALEGVADGATAIYPSAIPADAPAYMLAWAIGDYEHAELGTTAAGTRVGVYYTPELADEAMRGTAHLAAAFEWYETTLGPYMYGPEVASVSAEWGGGAYGGMEHHPYWHVSSASMGDEETHAHEAAHGWYGDGVRIRCWEDFVLSEGTVSYLTARALEAVAGPEAAERVWRDYESRLRWAQRSADMTVAWPDSCGEVDILEDGLFSSIPYMKGAFFYRALERRVGREALDGVLSSFYLAHRGEAAGMQDLLDAVEEQTGYDPTACATDWLRREEIPETDVCPEP